jgi:hypothetical protein
MVLSGSNAAAIYSASYLHKDDFEKVKTNQNMDRKRGMVQGKSIFNLLKT